jgi:hypothetical protein
MMAWKLCTWLSKWRNYRIFMFCKNQPKFIESNVNLNYFCITWKTIASFWKSPAQNDQNKSNYSTQNGTVLLNISVSGLSPRALGSHEYCIGADDSLTVCRETKVFLCDNIAQDFLQIGDVKIDVLKQPIIPKERCRLGNGWYSLEKSGGKLLEVSCLNMSKLKNC